jgi:hypothetical protein
MHYVQDIVYCIMYVRRDVPYSYNVKNARKYIKIGKELEKDTKIKVEIDILLLYYKVRRCDDNINKDV